MTSDSGVPEVSQNLRQDDFDALLEVIRDWHHRAAMFDQLMAAARAPHHDSGLASVVFDGRAWLAAEITHSVPRPQLRWSPALPAKPLAEWTQDEIRDVVHAHFEAHRDL